MTNAQRRQIVDEAKASGYQGSYVDLFKQATQNPAAVETPARMQQGDFIYNDLFRNSDGPRATEMPDGEMSDAEMSLKIIQEANAGNPAARRMRSDYGQKKVLKGETDPSTHYMATFDNYAVPLVQEDYIGGPLDYSPNPAPSNADFRFDTPEQALYFTENYKQASAAKAFNKKMRAGGPTDPPRTESFLEDAAEMIPGIGTLFSLNDAYYAARDMFQNPGEIGFNKRTLSNTLDMASLLPGGKMIGSVMAKGLKAGEMVADLGRVRNINRSIKNVGTVASADDLSESIPKELSMWSLPPSDAPKPLTPKPPTKLPQPGGKYSFRIGGVRYSNSRYRK